MVTCNTWPAMASKSPSVFANWLCHYLHSSMLGPPSLKTHSNSGKSLFPSVSADRCESKHPQHSVSCLPSRPPPVLDELFYTLSFFAVSMVQQVNFFPLSY